MKNKVIAFVTAIGILTAATAPANAQYWGGYGWGGYGAGLGVMAGAGFLGGLLGGAIASGGGYGRGYYGGGYNPWGVSYGYGYQPGYTVYQPAPGYYEGW